MSGLYGDSGNERARATEIPPLKPAQINIPTLLYSIFKVRFNKITGKPILIPLAINTKMIERKLITQ